MDDLKHFFNKFEINELHFCSGLRNKWFLDHFSHLKIISFVDERSAAFYALGKSKVTQKPNVIITTSGTAVGETLPAIMEAHHRQIPLIIISADRPQELQGIDYPQTCEQKLFSHYAKNILESDLKNIDQIKGPLHLNLHLPDPLRSIKGMGEQLSVSQGQELIEKSKNILPIIGELEDYEVPILQNILKDIFFETEVLSKSFFNSAFKIPTFDFFEDIKNLKIDLILRFGRTPTSTFWRDLDQSDIPVLSWNEKGTSGLQRSSSIKGPLPQTLSLTQNKPLFKALQKNLLKTMSQVLKEFPESEPSLFSNFFEKIKKPTQVFFGNSSPIRLSDFILNGTLLTSLANRGLNGIDGLMSTFLGSLNKNENNLCIVGDLSFLYDLNSLSLFHLTPFKKTLVVINNNGSGLFRQKNLHHPAMINETNFSIKDIAQAFQIPWTMDLDPNFQGIIELKPNLEQTNNFYKNWQIQQRRIFHESMA